MAAALTSHRGFSEIAMCPAPALDRSALHRLRRVLGLALFGLVTVIADAPAFSVTSNVTPPSCRMSGPGYVDNARFMVTAANTGCTGTSIVVTTASPSGGTPSPPTSIGFPAGPFNFQPVVPGIHQMSD